jgi:hypothetical protein
MASCKFEILVSAYLDKELSAEERDLFERHVAGCPTCREVIAEWREVERALRRQRLRQALREESDTVGDVMRELSRSGEFRRARRKSAWHRFREAVAGHRRLVVGTTVALVVVVVAGIWLGSLWWPNGPMPAATPRPDEPMVRPALPAVLAEVSDLLSELTGPAGSEPGAGARFKERLNQRDLVGHIAWERCRQPVDSILRDRLLRLEAFLVLLSHLPADAPDAAASLAEAARTSRLPAQVVRLRVMAAAGVTPTTATLAEGPDSVEAGAAPLTKFLSRPAAESVIPIKDAAGGPESRYLLGMAQTAAGMPNDAVRTLASVAAEWPSSPLAGEAKLAASRVWRLDLDQPDKATELCRQLMTDGAAGTLRLAALLEIGQADERRDRFTEARAVYSQVVAEARQLSGELARRVAARFAAVERHGLIEAAGESGHQALVSYVKAERLAWRPQTRNAAAMELIGLTAIHRNSPLEGDALAMRMYIHLLAGEDVLARNAFVRLRELRPARLSVEPLRTCAPHMARWLLEDVDRRVAGGTGLFPELFGYTEGKGLKGPDGEGRVVGLVFDRPDGTRTLALAVNVYRAFGTDDATYASLGLRVDETVRTNNEMLAGEIRHALGIMDDILMTLDRAAGRIASSAVVDTTGQDAAPAGVAGQ